MRGVTSPHAKGRIGKTVGRTKGSIHAIDRALTRTPLIIRRRLHTTVDTKQRLRPIKDGEQPCGVFYNHTARGSATWGDCEGESIS